MKNKPYIVIMAGGIGSRFWPYSRYKRPKQFLDILGTGRTLLQMTFDRFLKISDKSMFYVVTNKKYEDLVKEQLPEIPHNQILTEPLRRNTAACIAYASYRVLSKDPDAKLIVTPSDHLIIQEDNFFKAVEISIAAAETVDRLITIGIRPNRPETGYGYIQYHSNQGNPIKKVKTFTEKPNLKLAKTFLESGDFVWNSGVFIWKVASIVRAFEKYMPDISEAFEEGHTHFCTETEANFIKKAYSLLKSISIDFGIMEKAEEVYVVLGDFGWSDLGSWSSLHEVQPKDESNNVVEANAILSETKNCYIKVSPDKLVVVEGLDNYLISESENVLIVCKMDGDKKFREYVNAAKLKGEDFV